MGQRDTWQQCAPVVATVPLVKYDGSCLMKWQSTRLADMTHLASDILNKYAHPLSESLINYAQPRELDSSAFTSLPGPSK